MRGTNYYYAGFVIAFLVSLALYGMVVVEFLFTTAVCIAVGAAVLYIFMGFFYFVDRVINYFYAER